MSLAQLDADKLAWILHPEFHECLRGVKEKSHVFAETVAFPLHDVWAPRDEVYTSAARFERSMTTEWMVSHGHYRIHDRWPLKLPIDMATGCQRDFPAELFALAWDETIGNGWLEKRMRLHGFDAIVPGEFTLVFLHEADLGCVHLNNMELQTGLKQLILAGNIGPQVICRHTSSRYVAPELKDDGSVILSGCLEFGI
ncbi:hypothetical protein F4680DRAFT_450537 [Xylaria scruposa]|nr:hypothetical protein F4680DRAFT_450537 [Xylaria scruposa]